MLPALLIAASHAPSSMWNSPSNISGAVLILVGVVGIVFALVLAKVLKRFNGFLWALMVMGILVGLGGVWRMAG